MSDEVRIGIIGCGGIARNHLAAINKTDGITITAATDLYPEAAKKFAEAADATVYDSLDDLLANSDVQGVIICTPPAGRIDVVKKCLDANMPMLSEKPIAINLAEAEKLSELVKQSDVPFFVGFCHRFFGPVIEAKKIIDSGRIGRPLLFRNMFAGYLELKGNHRATPEVSGGGCLIDHCCHSIDLFRHLMGEPNQVHALKSNAVQDVAIEDLGSIQMKTADGAIGQICASYSLPVGGSVVEIFCEKGALRIDYGGQPDLTICESRDSTWEAIDCTAHPSRFEGEVAHFADILRNGTSPRVTIDDGVAANAIVDRVYASANQ